MFKKIVIVSLTALTVDYFCGDKATDIILNLFKAVFYPIEVPSKTEQVFTKEELKLFNGIDKPQLYLAILGKIFDVSKGAKHYGPGKQYNVFVGMSDFVVPYEIIYLSVCLNRSRCLAQFRDGQI